MSPITLSPRPRGRRPRRIARTALAAVLLAALSWGGVALAGNMTRPAEDASDDAAEVVEPADVEAAAEQEAEPRQRSVLFYLIDTCRGDRMGYQGYERETTPFLSWLAERSVVFEACFSQAPWTKPSMASMLTSQYPSSTGIYRMAQQMPDSALTWPEVLDEAGYHTAGFSTNIVMSNIMSRYGQGFDHFVESIAINNGDPIDFASRSARLMNGHVFRYLDRTDEWPMLLYMHSVDPHEEYEPEEAYLKKFADPERDPAFREEWQRLLADRPGIPGLHLNQDNFDRTNVDVESFIEHGSNLYDADILANDDQMERLWQQLQKDGWADDFVFIFTSDHGEEFFEHGGTSHGYSLYNEMIHVPLMIYAPGLLPQGKRIRTPVRSLDIFPTLCDLLDLEIPESVQGESLLPLIEEPGSWEERPIISEHREDPGARRVGAGSGVMVSVQAGPWKFILNKVSHQKLEKPRYELFDLDEDPGETVNLADEYPDVVRAFEVQVATFIEDHRPGEKAIDWVQPDPAVLDQLRKLGYLPDEPMDEAAEAKPEGDLFKAACTGDLETLTAWADHGIPFDQLAEATRGTVLSHAAWHGQVEALQLLLDAGAPVDIRNEDGSTALQGAVFFGQPDAVEMLLEAGADAEARNAAGDSIVDVAKVSWEITEFVVGFIGLNSDRATIEAGRKRAVALIQDAINDGNG